MTSSPKKVKKLSGKKLTEWACPLGECDVSKAACAHLEAYLPQMRDGDSPQYIDSAIVGSRMSVSIYDVKYPKFSLPEFHAFLRKYGFVDEWDIELLTNAYFYRLSQRWIAEEYGVDQSIISRRLKNLRTSLVERGIEKELNK
jgi:hypothetical protein